MLNFGGSIKLFDLLGLLFAAHQVRCRVVNNLTLVVMCISLVGLVILLSETYFGFRDTYQVIYPSSKSSIRHGSFAGVFYVGILLMVWYGTTRILSSDRLIVFPVETKIKIIRNFINFGVFVALYSLWAMIFVGNLSFPDIVPSIFDARNSQPEDYSFRTVGFSDEPSMLFVTLNFLLFLMLSFGTRLGVRYLKSKIFIVGLSLLLTFSSLMISVILATFIYCLLKMDLRIMIRTMFIFGFATSLLYLIAKYLGIVSFLVYSFYFKFLTFFSANLTVGAGFRSFTTRTGIDAVLQYPFGAGFGQHFVLWQTYLNEKGLSHPSLDYTSVVQSGLVQFALEFGIIGLLLFIFYFYLVYKKVCVNLSSEKTIHTLIQIWLISHFIISFVAFPLYSPVYYFPLLFILWVSFSLKVHHE